MRSAGVAPDVASRALLAATLLGAFLFLAGLGAYLDGGLGDASARDLVTTSGSPTYWLAWGVSEVGSTAAGIAMVLVAAAYAWWRGHRRGAFLAALAVLVASLADLALKLAFDRARPPYALVAEDPWSFPSGHATRAASLACALAWSAWRLRAPRDATRGLVLAGGAWALLVADARLALGVHYLSDVVGGLGVGLGATAATLLVGERFIEAPPSRAT